MKWIAKIFDYVSVPQRVILSIFGFFAIVNACAMRLCLDIALTQMVNRSIARKKSSQSESGDKEISRHCSSCSSSSIYNYFKTSYDSIFGASPSSAQKSIHAAGETTLPLTNEVTHDWSSQMQTVILTSFYVGYVISHVPGGMLAEKYGGKWVLAVGVAVTAVLTILTPLAIKVGGAVALIVVRFVIGLSEGPTVPALSTLLAQWVPASERGKLVVLVLSAGQISVFFVNLISSLLLHTFEWTLVFYYFGGCALVWLVGFVLLCYSYPDTHPYIREKEKQYLEQQIGHNEHLQEHSPTPWKQIFTSAPMWALISATMEYDWTQAVVVADVPEFISDVRQLTFSESLYSSISESVPQILGWLISLLSGVLSDILINRHILSSTLTRRVMTLFAGIGPSLFLGMASCFPCQDDNQVVGVFKCAVGVMGTYYAGIKLTPLDMSPNYAGTLVGIANGLGSLMVLLAPYVADVVTKYAPFSKLHALLWMACTMLASVFILPQRYILTLMGFFAIVNAYTMRICLSVAITRLVVARNYSDAQMNDTKEQYCPKADVDVSVSTGGSYDWSQELQGFILSSFYIGYIVTHIPGGLIAEIWGGKYVLSLGILSTGLFTLLTPLVITQFGSSGLITLRILMGAGEGTTFPALCVLLSRWVPLKERATLGAFVLGGGQFGAIAGNALSGLILSLAEWPWVFYIFGIAAIIWFILFTLLCFNDPASHPYVKETELNYLMVQMGALERRHDLPPTPWKHILTSAPMWALICAQIGHDWGLFVMVTDLPKYMNDVMQFPIKQNGMFSSLPFVLMWVVSVMWGPLTDCVVRSGRINTTIVRKFNTTLAAFGPGIFMICASYAGCDKMLVVILFTICMGFMGPYYSGMKLTPLDMSPNYCGVIMALTNGIGAVTGIIAPVTVGWMTPNTTMAEWRMVFWLALVILAITAIIYDIWASGEIQPWNDPATMPKKEKHETKPVA